MSSFTRPLYYCVGFKFNNSKTNSKIYFSDFTTFHLPPETIKDLKVVSIDYRNIELSWSSSKDNHIGNSKTKDKNVPIIISRGISPHYELRVAPPEYCDTEPNNYWLTLSKPKVYPVDFEGEPYSYNLSNLMPDTTYCLSIKVYNGAKWSLPSKSITVTTKKEILYYGR